MTFSQQPRSPLGLTACGRGVCATVQVAAWSRGFRIEGMKSRASRFTRPLRSLAALGGLVVLVGAAACAVRADRTDSTEGEGAQPLAEQADEGERARHRHHHAPLRRVFEAVLEQGDLSAEQDATVREIQAELQVDREAKRLGREKFKAAAVGIVRSGTADSEQFERAVEQATAAIEERMDVHSDALLELHAILDTDQRVAVADGLRERIAKRFGERKQAHRKKGIKRVVSYLMLSPLQLDKLKAMRQELMGPTKRLRPSRDELEALVAAFEGDEFEKALDAFQDEKIDILKKRLARAGEHTDTVLTLLDDGQRELLADLIERGPKAVFQAEQQ
jgi:hypothetical protein